MKLSVIVICYNQVEYIQKAVDSVLCQKFKDDLEIIIGDDGSNDGSYELIREKYGNKSNIKIFQMSRDPNIRYLPYVRQCQIKLEALKYVEGEYFSILDGDDFFCDDKGLQKKVDMLDKKENTDIYSCGSNFWYYSDEKYIRKGVSERLREGRVLPRVYWQYYYIHVSTFVFRSVMIPCLPYAIIEKEYNDNIILFCALQYGDIYYINDTTLCYRQGVKNSIWSNGKTRDKNIRQVMEIDIANKINKKMWWETYYRYRSSVKYLLDNRVENENEDLLNLAKELECHETLELLNLDVNKKKRSNKRLLLKHFILQIACNIRWIKRHFWLQTRLGKYVK